VQAVVGRDAFGKPGIEPRWTHSNKSGVGTAYCASSHLWFTIWNGIVTEVYYPTVDRPQLRDLQYLVTDGKTFFHEEKRDLTVKMERISDHVLGYRCINADAKGRYTITKDIIGDPHLPCLLQRARISGKDRSSLTDLKLFALCAPHLEGGGSSNNWLRHERKRPAHPDGTERRQMDGDGRDRSLFAPLLRVCRPKRRLDGPTRRLQDGLGV